MTPAPPVDLLVIGAGPAGAVAAALARRRGYSVRVLEKQQFPRFSIGESLLPQCMEFLQEAGLLEAVRAFGFQYKNGAQIARGGHVTSFEFSQKTCPGWDWTWQVTRADFDKVLADGAAAQGAEVIYQEEITAVDVSGEQVQLTSRDTAGSETRHTARFLFDASGFARVLPRLLNLEKPSGFPLRGSLFTHVEDRITDGDFDRNKIRVTVHPHNADVWFWLIPFAHGRASVGVVADDAFLQGYPGDNDARLWAIVREEPDMARLLRDATPLWPAREIRGYAASVTSLHGHNYALLGNAGEFLDPVFSSGVTIAMKGASLAVDCMDRQLCGASVDWEGEFAKPLMLGVETFRGYVETWYEGALQDVMLSTVQPPDLRAGMCSVLAGYAWDKKNPYVGRSGQRLRALARLVREQNLLPPRAAGA